MKARRIILLSLLVGSAYVAFVGCGDEETTNTSTNTDAGNETSTTPDTGTAGPAGGSPASGGRVGVVGADDVCGSWRHGSSKSQ